MESLKELYKIGRGPSSSHTIGPEIACKMFLEENPKADEFKVVLYESLAKTGDGHGTARVIKTVLPNANIISDINSTVPHPNTMDLIAIQKGKEVARVRVYSIGGGTIQVEGRNKRVKRDVYPLHTLTEIRDYCEKNQMRLCDFVYECEGVDIRDYLKIVWQTMKSAIEHGTKATGILPGGLFVERKANMLLTRALQNESMEMRESRLVSAYAFAVAEENAAGGLIVVAPTCGACGVLPAVLFYFQKRYDYTETEIIDALATAGLIGNIIKENASISGAECGCQAEIGSACCMASVALAQLQGLTLEQIEYAAEIAMEHHLGLTCDPICGLVQIPCIERNAVAALRAVNSSRLAYFLSKSHKISFDLVVRTMKETGKDLKHSYRETAEGGLAKLYNSLK